MKEIVFVLFVSIFFSSIVSAKGRPSEGKNKIGTCSACHSKTGRSIAPNYPHIAGQGERYLITQITDIKEGTRSVPEMAPFVANLSKQDIEDIAAYYSSQTPVKATTDPDKLKLGRDIFRFGNLEKKIPACTGCHSASGSGNSLAGFPALSGQTTQYLVKQLKDYRNRTRNSNEQAKIMQKIASRISDEEIEAVSSYISGLQ